MLSCSHKARVWIIEKQQIVISPAFPSQYQNLALEYRHILKFHVTQTELIFLH